MAVFDQNQQKIVVRVIYDGPGSAGKTTNLQQLCNFFTKMRRSDLFVPRELNGRTLYFDWLQVEGGVVGGYGLRCQLLTVPGQKLLEKRRQHLLKTADAVVFVCESTPVEIQKARRRLDALKEYLRLPDGEGIPLVIQANKQDAEGSLSYAEVLTALNLDAGTPLIVAQAHEGIGVRETVVLAIRAAANRMQKLLLEQSIDSIIGTAENGEQLFQSMLNWEAQSDKKLEAMIAEADVGFSDLDLKAFNPDEKLLAASDEEFAQDNQKIVTGEDTCALSEVPVVKDHNADLSDRVREEKSFYATAEPVFPQYTSPSGCIWPAATGREIIRYISYDDVIQRDDLTGQHGSANGSGKTDLLIYKADSWCLKTSRRRYFKDIDEARNQLIKLAGAKMSLDTFTLPGTVLAIQPDSFNGYWLWTISPWVETLRSEMTDSGNSGDEDRLASALMKFATVAVEAMLLAARRNIILDVHPSNFADLDGRFVYIDDDIGTGSEILTIGYALLHRVEENARWVKAVALYLMALEDLMMSRLTASDIARLNLIQTIEHTFPRSSAALEARNTLLLILARCCALN